MTLTNVVESWSSNTYLRPLYSAYISGRLHLRYGISLLMRFSHSTFPTPIDLLFSPSSADAMAAFKRLCLSLSCTREYFSLSISSFVLLVPVLYGQSSESLKCAK